VKNYKVVMLGSSGSGKTVFLASMFHELFTQGERGFFLKVEGKESERRLVRIYEQVATQRDWPPGTKLDEISEWIFTCYVQAKDRAIFPTCQFIYLDYAGGRLTDILESDEVDSEFETKLEQADALLGLLDGQKILAAMKGDGFAWNALHLIDLKNMLMKMQNSRAPIHFVISKWDLLDGEFTLEQVLERLLELDSFRNLVKQRNQANSPVRLIPVSSVGKGFAVPQRDGSMQKTGKTPRPFQVEMPLACVVPDMMESKLKQLLKQKEEEAARVVEVKANINWWDRLGQFFGGSITVVRHLLPVNYQFTDKAMENLSKFASSGIRKKRENAAQRSEELRKERDEALTLVNSEITALEYTITCFAQLREILMYQFPDSELRLS
jgi:hypothetical protein